MKRNIIYICLLLVALLFSCDDIVTYNDHYDDGTTSYGPPAIERVCDMREPDLTIEWGEMDEMVVIYGTNLSHVKAIYFNDIPADLKEVHALANVIGVRIPVGLPGRVTNQIKVVTELGETTFPFEVFIPKLVVDGVDNEFAAAGDTVTITGKYFELFNITKEKARITLGGKPVNVLSSSDTRLTMVVPADAADLDNTTFSISSDMLKEPIILPFHTTGAFTLIDFAHRTDLKQKEADPEDGSKAGYPRPLVKGQPYFWFERSLDPWKWVDLSWNYMEPMDATRDADVINHLSDYYLKFEILTRKNIKGAQLRVSIGNTTDWSDKEFRWKTADGGAPFDTNGKWKTVSIDMAKFKELPQLKPGTYVDNGRVVGMNFITVSICDSPVDEDLAFAYTNFRFVKK